MAAAEGNIGARVTLIGKAAFLGGVKEVSAAVAASNREMAASSKAAVDSQVKGYATLAEAQAAYRDKTAATAAENNAALAAVGKKATIGIAAAGALLVYEGLKIHASFQSAMLQSVNLAGVSQSRLGALTAGIKAMSPAVNQGLTPLANALYRIASTPAGLKATNAQLLNMVRYSAMLSTIGGPTTDLESTARIMGGVMTSGVKGTNDPKKIATIAAATVGSGDIRMSDVVDFLGSGATTSAKLVGASYPQLMAFLALAGSNLQSGQVSGHAIAHGFQLMAAPTPQAQEALGAVGLGATTLAQTMRNKGLGASAVQLGKALQAPLRNDADPNSPGLSQTLAKIGFHPDQIAQAESIGLGQMGAQGKSLEYLILTRMFGGAKMGIPLDMLVTQSANYNEILGRINKSGNNPNALNNEMARQMDTLSGKTGQFTKSLANLADTVGSDLTPALKVLLTIGTDVTSFFTQNQAAGIALAAVTTGILGPAIGVYLVKKFSDMGGAISTVVKGYGNIVQAILRKLIPSLYAEDAALVVNDGALATNDKAVTTNTGDIVANDAARSGGAAGWLKAIPFVAAAAGASYEASKLFGPVYNAMNQASYAAGATKYGPDGLPLGSTLSGYNANGSPKVLTQDKQWKKQIAALEVRHLRPRAPRVLGADAHPRRGRRPEPGRRHRSRQAQDRPVHERTGSQSRRRPEPRLHRRQGSVQSRPGPVEEAGGEPLMAIDFSSAGIAAEFTQIADSQVATNQSWATLLLTDGGFSPTDNNVQNVMAWMAAEEPPTNWFDRNNPLNCGQGPSGGGSGQGSYPDLNSAAFYTAQLINEPNMAPIQQALAGNVSRLALQAAVFSTQWGTVTPFPTTNVPVITDVGVQLLPGSNAAGSVNSGTFNPEQIGPPVLPPAPGMASNISADQFIINGSPIDVDVSGALVNVGITLDATQISVLELTMNDPMPRPILNSVVLGQQSVLTIGSLMFQLQMVEKQGSTVTASFSPWVVVALKSATGAVTVPPGIMTRTKFASLLVAQVQGAEFAQASESFLYAQGLGYDHTTLEQLSRGTKDLPLEDSWTCLQRLATEIGWRCFEFGGTVYFGPDSWLTAQTPAVTLVEGQNGVGTIDGTYDGKQPLGELTVNDSSGAWAPVPGDCVNVAGLGPMSGLWLVVTLERASLFHPDVTVTLQKPNPILKEPSSGGAQAAVGPGFAQTGNQQSATGSSKALQALQYCKNQLGVPYQWGGDNPQTGFDCSGLMQAAYQAAGVPITRTTYTQMPEFPLIPAGAQNLRPGDLVFFGTPGNPTHVGMFVSWDSGTNVATMIDAYDTGSDVRYDTFAPDIGAVGGSVGSDQYLGANRPAQ